MEGLSAEAFPQELADLIGLFSGEVFTGGGLLPGQQGARPSITATPGRGDMPAIWLLGSSGYSAQLAGLLGLPFSFAHHFSAANTVPALALYRQHFRPSAWLREPYAMVAVSAICADTDEHAQWLSGPAALSFLRLRAGRPEPLASPEEAAAYPYTDQEREFARDRFTAQAVGSPETVRQQLAGLLDRTEADELMLTTMVYDIQDRIHSFELIADKVAGGLARPAS
jgi:luciferase family oxidoreductase group 1